MTDAFTILPPEIWLQIIDSIRYNASLLSVWDSDRATVKNLSRVSSSLRSLSQPDLFRALNISWICTDYEPIKVRLRGLLELLKNRPESAYWIKTFRCDGHTDSVNQVEIWALVLLLSLQLQAVTLIRFSHFQITRPMISHFRHLTTLHTLHVDTALWLAPNFHTSEINSEGIATDVLPSIGTPSISVDSDTRSRTESILVGLVSTPSLRSLSIGGRGSFQVVMDVIHSCPLYTFSHISSLSLSSDLGLYSLFNFPNLFPNLTHLQLMPFGRTNSPPIPSPSALQKLQTSEETPLLLPSWYLGDQWKS